MKNAIKFVLRYFIVVLSLMVSFSCRWASATEVVGDDQEATNAVLSKNPAPKLTQADLDGVSSTVSLFGLKEENKVETYYYRAYGDLSESTSGTDITLYFDVTDFFAEVKSARIVLNAYDVDYPSATEADITYLNGSSLGWWLQGGNEEWNVNNIPIKNLNLLKTPATVNETARNIFFVDVNAHNDYWVTCISEAYLIIEGTTFNVTASDGSELGGILVEWTNIPNASYTLWRGEKRGEKTVQLASGSLTQYFDETAEPKTCYYYTVEATLTSGVSLYSTQKSSLKASDDGFHDLVFPNIEKIELPEFWLDDIAPLAITWNNYDPQKFTVKDCMVRIAGPSDRKDEIPAGEIAPGKRLEFDAAKRKKFSDKDFGEYTVKVTWDVDAKVSVSVLNRISLWFDKSTEEKKIKLFFNKYAGHFPNWYFYWPKMGAIDKSLIGGGMVKFGYYPKLNARGECYAPPSLPSVFSPYSGTYKSPNIYYTSPYDMSKITYKVSPYSATQKREYTLNNGTKVSKEAKGLEALALVLTHELKHGELYKEYCRGISREKPLIATPHQKSNAKTIEELVEHMKIVSEFNANNDIKNYANTILEIIDKGVYTADLDGDLVLDNEEEESWFSWVSPPFTLRGNPDSRGVVNARNAVDGSGSGYEKIGDNEALALLEERLSPVSFSPSKDWAFPGTNCYPEHSGLRKTQWDTDTIDADTTDTIKGKILKEVFGAFETTTSSTFAMSSSTRAYSTVALASEDEGSPRTGGDLTKLPSLYEFAGEGLSIDGDVFDQTADYTEGNGYSALAISIPFVNSGEAISAAEVSGYLVNEKDEPVAFAQTVCDLPAGKTDVILEFPGDSLQKMKSASYQLALVQVEASYGDLGMTMFSKTELANSTFAYTNTQFVGNVANYLYNTFSEEKTQEGLQIEVKGIITTPGVYQLEARLEGADGDLVSHIGYEKEFAAGEMTASFVFPNEEIYLSRQNGPYDICFVRISQDGEVLDERRMVYQTGSYDYTDFTPANVCLVVDETSFKRGEDVVGADGLITSMPFSFDVDYQGEVEERCQGWLYLYGEGDCIVTVSQADFSLVKGCNTLEFLVDGASIQKSGVNGPYTIKKILLEPQNGAAETFVPTMEPIELNPEDFGAYPFAINGSVDFAENEGGYELAVPLEILRANTITLTAMLVDENGRYVTSATSTKTYSNNYKDVLKLVFTEAEINASERKGPYTVRFIQIKTDIPGIAPVDIPVPETAKEITKAYTRYVDCLNENDVCDGYTWETAFRTIQEAVDIADPGDVILVADGVYEPFVTENKAISIVSLNGYTRTFIDGAGYARCATLGYEASHQDTVLDGFTLFDGNASTSAVSVLWNCGGGVCCGTVLNCRVVNCTAEKGGASYYGFLENCLLDWNEATNAGGGSYYGIRLNCTIVDNYAKNSGGGTYEGDTYNSIVWGNVRGTSSYVLENYYGGEFYFSNTTPAVSGDGNISQYPCFRDWENRDYRLALDSPCEDVGYTFSFAEAIDLLGNPRVRGDSVDMGAYETYRSYYQEGFCDFVEEEITTTEKTSVTPVSILGGREGQACSVQLNLTHNTTAAADILNVMCESADGRLETVSKFPYTVNWDVGEVEKKSIKIFIKDDALIEDDEFFTLQLANPVGMELGEFRTCTVKVYDEDAPQSLANAIQNASLKPTTKGDGKWSVENGNRSYVKDDTYDLYAISPLMTSGQQSTLSLASVTGPGTLYFSLKFVGVEEGTLPSKLVVYNGQKEVGSLTPANQDDDWGEWIVTVNEEGKQALSFKFIQGEKSSVQARITRVYWIPANSRVDRIPLILKTSPVEGGYTSGSGVYPRGEKMSLVAMPRPGWEFVGWYLQSGALFDTNPKQNLYFNASASGAVTLIAQFKKTPYIRALADTLEGGTVTGSGYCTSGKKVTLKATANKGFKFKGWYATRMGSSVLFDATQCVATTPTLVIDRTAKPAATTDKSTTITDVVGDTTYFAYFEGEPRMEVSRNSDEAGKVTGAGRYAPGTKVTLKATANKGYVFAGWYKDAEFMTPCDSSSVDYRAPTYSLVMGECEQELFARFVPVAEDVVLDLTIDGKPLPVDEALQFEGEIRLGCEVESYSLPKITVAGLPTGMKFTSVPVTLKATANTPATVVPRNTIYGTPTMPGMYTVKVSLTNASIKKAIVKTFDVYVPNLTDDAIPLADSYGPFTPGVTYTVPIDGAVGCSVTGLPKGMKWTATDIVDKKTMSVTVPANAAYGVPTTPGNYTATFTKTIDGVKHVATATFTVGALPKLIVDVSEYGKVTGAGAFIANKSVTLTAKANKGYVFAGWYKDAEFTTPCDSTLVDYRNPKYSYTMDVVDTRLYPRFVTLDEEANYMMDVNLSSLEYPLDLGDIIYEYEVGETILPLSVVVKSLTLPKVSVVGLPKGMTYNSKTFVISGKPTKIGESIFLVMVQNASQTASVVREFPIIIYSSEE